VFHVLARVQLRVGAAALFITLGPCSQNCGEPAHDADAYPKSQRDDI
jgi:hypothetical protein